VTPARDRVDVVVIGSGAAGAALTWSLAHHGAKVVCLEQGDWVRADQMASGRTDFETAQRRGPDTLFPSIRKRPEDYPIVTEGGLRPDQVLMFNGVGGTTVHWEGHFPRMHPSDFRVRSLDGVAADWPIRYEDLERYYDLNDRHIGVSGLAGDPAQPPRAARPTPPCPSARAGARSRAGSSSAGTGGLPTTRSSRATTTDGRPATSAAGATSAARGGRVPRRT
jgi:choline dehydrogenase-like flavoprotein